MDLPKKIVSAAKLYYKGYAFYRWQIVALAFLGLLGGLLEGIGVNAVIPLFSFLTGGQNGDDFISRFIESAFTFVGVPFSLRYLIVFILLLFLFRTVTIILNNYIKFRISTDYSETMRNRLFQRVLEADWPHLLKQKLGHLNSILLTNISYAESLLQNISATVMILGGLVMYITVAINISMPVTLITVILALVLFLVFKPLTDKTRALSRQLEKLNLDISHFVNENVVGLKTVKALLASKPVVEKARVSFRSFKKLRVSIFLLQNLPQALMPFIGLVFVLVVFVYSYKAPNFNLAALAAVVYLINRIFIYIQQLQGQFQALGEYSPYLESLLKYEDEAVLNREKEGKGEAFFFNNSLDFKNVGFEYSKDNTVFENLSFSVKQGEMLGIIGPSGSGKTTLVDLILRLFRPTSGSIVVDGKDIFDIGMTDWRRAVGYVSQDMFLINDTIANNIRFYSALSDEEVAEAARMANIYDFVESTPDKFNTQIGERGVMLSGGQRQRIMIARVLARKPKVLILDEATSSLDNESEKEIQFVIEGLRGKITVLIIAHRLSTVMNADRLIALEKGKVVETGSPKELLNDNSSYLARMSQLQSTD